MWKIVTISSKKPPKGSKKVWEELIRRLRTQNVQTVKDFQAECEWKWFVNNHSERWCIKENDNMHKVHKSKRK